MDTLITTGLKVVGVAIYGGITIIYGNNYLERQRGLGVILVGAGWILSGM